MLTGLKFKGAGAAARSVGIGKPPKFAQEEDELYVRLICRRIVHGYPVNHFWLQMEFAAILEEGQRGPSPTAFRYRSQADFESC